MRVDGETLTVNIEYPKGEYDTIEEVEGIELVSSSGVKTTLKDIANIAIYDSPAGITKYNKKYWFKTICK